MKKIVSILTVAVCLFMTLPAQAQFSFGVKGGMNISKVTFSKDVLKGDNRTGFFIGPTAEFTIPIIGLGIDVAALYSQTDSKIKGRVDNETYGVGETLKSIEVPLNLKWTLGLGSTLGVFLAVGPQFGFNVGDSDYVNAFDMKKCYTSFNLGGGVKFLRHLQAGLNYNFGISKMAHSEDQEGTQIELKKNTWQISLAYIF